MNRKNEKTVRKVDIMYPYDKHPTLRRSGMGASAWEYTVQKFGITADPKNVMSITIEGEDDFGHLLLSYILEEDGT